MYKTTVAPETQLRPIYVKQYCLGVSLERLQTGKLQTTSFVQYRKGKGKDRVLAIALLTSLTRDQKRIYNLGSGS